MEGARCHPTRERSPSNEGMGPPAVVAWTGTSERIGDPMRVLEATIEASGRVGDCIGSPTEPGGNIGGHIRQFPSKIWLKEEIGLDGTRVPANL